MPSVVRALSYILPDHTDAQILFLFEVWRLGRKGERFGSLRKCRAGAMRQAAIFVWEDGRLSRHLRTTLKMAAGFLWELCQLQCLWPFHCVVCGRQSWKSMPFSLVAFGSISIVTLVLVVSLRHCLSLRSALVPSRAPSWIPPPSLCHEFTTYLVAPRVFLGVLMLL